MKIIPLLPLLFLSAGILAQSKENERFVWGFFIAAESQSLGIQPLDTKKQELAAVQPGRPGMGASVGFFGRKRCWRGLFFQPEAVLAFNKNAVRFRGVGEEDYRFVDAEIPLHFVLTDWRRNDYPLRACVIFGGRASWNLAQNPSKNLEIARERFALDLGLGAEIRLGKWLLQPSLLYSHGMNNIHNLSNAEFDWLVGRAARDKLSLRLSIWRGK